MRATLLTAVALLMALLAGACGGQAQRAGQASPSHEHPHEEAVPVGCDDLRGMGTVEIAAVDNEFEPLCVVLTGVQSFSVTNEGDTDHTFTIDNTEVDIEMAPGEGGETGPIGDVVEPGSGEHEFHCTLHPSMVGYFTITER